MRDATRWTAIAAVRSLTIALGRPGFQSVGEPRYEASVTKLWAGCVFALLAMSTLAVSARADELSTDAAAAFDLSTLTAGLELPTAIEFLPDGRLVITEKMGRVLVRLPSGE